MIREIYPSIEMISKLYNKPAIEFRRRVDGRIEWVCEHGVGHTVWWPKHLDGVHGCDGCCKELKEMINND